MVWVWKIFLGTAFWQTTQIPRFFGGEVGKQLTSMTCLDLGSPNSQVVCVALERGYDVLNAIQRDQPDPWHHEMDFPVIFRKMARRNWPPLKGSCKVRLRPWMHQFMSNPTNKWVDNNGDDDSHQVPSLKLTVRPWKLAGNPAQKEIRWSNIPTIHFQGPCMLVLGSVFLSRWFFVSTFPNSYWVKHPNSLATENLVAQMKGSI